MLPCFDLSRTILLCDNFDKHGRMEKNLGSATHSQLFTNIFAKLMANFARVGLIFEIFSNVGPATLPALS